MPPNSWNSCTGRRRLNTSACWRSDGFAPDLERGGAFNHGKLYVYAEFSVFRREFLDRFPEASPAACINAFSGLFLKNDISIHNLVEFIEGADDAGQLRLNSPEP